MNPKKSRLMNQNFKLTIAKRKGERVAKQFGGNSLPVNLSTIANKHNILIDTKDNFSKGVSGMLLRHGNSFGIMYSTHIKNKGFQRFSIAHELGHYFLEGHIDHILPDKNSVHNSSAGFISGDFYEMEADHFASGLLMPDNLIQPIIKKTPPGLFTIKKIAESCETSLVSSAIRYTSLSEDAVAIIVSKGTIVEFCFLSQAMKSLPEISWPAKKSLIPAHSLTAQLNKKTRHLLQDGHEEDEIDIRDWLCGNKSFQVKEEVQRLGSYNKTLTVLSYFGDIEEIINNEEDKLRDSWKPRFKK